MLNVIESFSIFGLEIHFYGLLIAVAMILGVMVVCLICKRRGLKADDILVLALYALPLALIGARAFYIIFETEGYTFVQMLQVWNGGMVLYGGIIGGAIGVVIYCLIHKKNFLLLADVAVVGLILGQAIGRIGCYFGGCCYGKDVTNPNMQWFPFASIQKDGLWHLCTFFFEFALDMIIFAVLFILIRKIKTKGIVFSIYLMSYGFIRFMLEFIRGDEVWTMGSLRVSQYISIILIVAGAALLTILLILKRNHKPQFEDKK